MSTVIETGLEERYASIKQALRRNVAACARQENTRTCARHFTDRYQEDIFSAASDMVSESLGFAVSIAPSETADIITTLHIDRGRRMIYGDAMRSLAHMCNGLATNLLLNGVYHPAVVVDCGFEDHDNDTSTVPLFNINVAAIDANTVNSWIQLSNISACVRNEHSRNQNYVNVGVYQSEGANALVRVPHAVRSNFMFDVHNGTMPIVQRADKTHITQYCGDLCIGEAEDICLTVARDTAYIGKSFGHLKLNLGTTLPGFWVPDATAKRYIEQANAVVSDGIVPTYRPTVYIDALHGTIDKETYNTDEYHCVGRVFVGGKAFA